MEIPKAMQEEINSTQNKLGKAILEHQKCMGMLKEDPNNSDIRKQKEQIQLHILSLGKIQKQIVERLRKTVQNDAADNANGSKVSIKFPSLWGLNNNNHITNNNETKHETVANGFETKPSKEDYEEVVANGDVPSPLQHNNCTKRSPNLVVTVSGEDDIVEVPMDENSNKKQDEMEEENEEKVKEKLKKILLSYLELMTTQEALELQNKKAERKRRSTANPQFVYSMMEQPAKRQKRVSYLQSGNAPHTRQTTARMNGPSPPPSSKAQATKSTSLQARANTKSLIPVQKSSTRPNILRNADSKVFASKNKVDDKQTQSSVTSAKTVQIGGKTVHLPALPSSLTIERIDNDSVLSPVCLSCRNKTPGPLTVCEICSWSYHVTCHTMPAPPNTCPKCTMVMELKKNVQKEEEAEGGERMDGEKPLEGDKLVATTLASGAIGKAREDSEIYKASGGLHKADASEKKRVLSSTLGINQLPASTFLIPITSDNSSDVEQSEDRKLSSATDNEQRQDVVAARNPVVLSQPQRSGVTYVQAEEQVSYSYQLPDAQPEKHQSYLIVKKITEPSRRADQPTGDQTDDQSHSAVVNYQLPATSGCSSSLEAGIVVAHSLLFGRNNRKRKTARAIPALHRIISSEGLLPVSPGDYQLERATHNGRKPWAKLSRNKLCVSQQSAGRPATETLFPSYSDCIVESSVDEHLEIAGPTIGGSAEESASFDSRAGKHRPARAVVHSLFSGNNRPYIVSDRAREPRGFGANERDCPLLRQQLCRLEQLEQSREPGRSAATVQLQRRALTRFFEHVKLEEAHIPAPLRTELVHKSKVALEERELGEDVGSRRKGARRYDGADGAGAALLTSSSNSDEDSLDEGTRRGREAANGVAVSRDPREKTVANWSPLCPSPSASSLAIASEHVKSSTLFFQSASRDNKQRDDDDGALRIAQSNLSELLNEVSVPDDKADTERQDLPSGGRPSSRSSISSSGGGSSSNSSSGNNGSSSSGHSDTPEQAMNSVNELASSHISKEMRELLNDNPTSPGEEELVRYVSAMHGSDDDDVVDDEDDDEEEDEDDDNAVTG
ncbi:PREDICTED: uncharacterized protein LOC106744588 isoform X1 [Dinoponera quadriceps]|uniref:Uncharacterized protein LOC106744588 isoform X1 n=1 Tax=Dinoponera quadriceps TaxID=609295 RepID=A0A6P3X9B2_DINQU|nr:PREDICTED: uncharacterized protein LOC106744588 isoform X1 [Dinoponera quadriceps]